LAFSLNSFSPINISYNAQPYWSANMTFSLAKANTPSCQNSTISGWFAGVNSDGQCAVETASEPVFRYTRIEIYFYNFGLIFYRTNHWIACLEC